MLRRQARLRREYLYRKSLETRQKVIQDKKERLKHCLDENVPIHYDLRTEALHLQEKLEWDDDAPALSAVGGGEEGGAGTSHEDDEYRWAGVENPKIMITTSHDPSTRLKKFVKELRLIFPNAQRMNRGNYEIKQLVQACRANEVTDFIVVHEHRGVPDTLIVCHMPYGPTAYFNLTDVVMRHDVPDIGTMSEQFPHLIFHNFETQLGKRTMNILKYLYPVPKEDSKRVISFANHDDYISFRHHTYKTVDGNKIEMSEVGPRFQLKLYQIKLGTLESADTADTEWMLRPYMNTASKRRYLSLNDGWAQDDEPEITAVSRSGRIIKKSSKLLGFESSDIQEKEKTPKSSKQSSKRQSSNREPLNEFNDDDNSMEFLEDQQHTESSEWTVDTKDCDNYSEPSGTSVSVGEHNQFMYALKNLNMKEPGFVAYALWAKEVRKTLMNAYPNFSTTQINQQLRDMWKSVPTEDKSRWVRKAKRLLEREGLDDSSTNDSKITVKKPSEEIIDKSIDTSNKNTPKSEALRSTQPIDAAAHLALLGESLGIIGQRLKEHQGQIAVNGSVSVLLDSLLCALGPLLCLTQQVTEINVNSQETMSRLMDDIAYIMPGL